MVKFLKYQALGNDYIVIHPRDVEAGISRDQVRLLCDRHYGVGSDGLLLGPIDSEPCDYGLRIFNPDGSEAEKSGSGLRIFARYIVDSATGGKHRFSVETAGGNVRCEVSEDGSNVTVEMGVVSFKSRRSACS
jgi:diaminopimelate epimerase